MKRLLFTLLLGGLLHSSFAQKISVKHDLVTLDRQPYARVETDGSAMFGLGQRTFYISAPTGERLLVVKELSYNDPAVASPANAAGAVQYVQFLFPGAHAVAELPMSGLGYERPIDIGRTLYVARLLRGTTLDQQAVADFVAVHGAPFSARRQLLDQALLRPLGY